MKHLRTLFLNAARFNRASIPEILADFENLPGVDKSALSDDARAEYENNEEAVRLFIKEPGVPLREITTTTGVHPAQIYRLVQRMVHAHEDGRVQGFRGLIPHKHLKDYVRTATVDACSRYSRGGAAGAMSQLLQKHPPIERWMRKVAKERNEPLKEGEVRAVRRSILKLHTDWLGECKKHGVALVEWPFNADYSGFRSFQEKVRELERTIRSENEMKEQAAGGSERTGKSGTRPEGWPVALRPFMLVQFDGHRIDVRLTIRIKDPYGTETLVEVHRIWLLVVTELKTRCILGFVLALGREYNKDDFAEALQAAIAPHHPVELTIPGLKVREGGGFPTQLQPELTYHCWDFLQYDEAKSHLSESSLNRVTATIGAIGVSGRLGVANDRAFQERLFGLLEQFGFHEIPGTVGSSPTDPVRELGDVGKDLTRLITYDELYQLAYVIAGDYNGIAQEGTFGRTPLDAMRYFTSRDDFLPRLLPITHRHQLFLLKEAVIKPICGSRKHPPHINFEHCRYTNDVLARRPELIGKKLRIYFMSRDLRTIHAFFEDGTELGILHPPKPWRTTPHSLRLRQEIFRLIRLGRLKVGRDDDPVQVYLRDKARQAKKSKDAATSVAKGQAGIAAAHSDERFGHSPFSPRSHRPPPPPEGASTPPAAPAADNTARTPIEPEPMTLSKGIVF